MGPANISSNVGPAYFISKSISASQIVGASKFWTKVKGFFGKVWNGIKKVLPFGKTIANAASVLPVVGPVAAVAGKVLDAAD